jgi:hypothetical protein
MSADGRYVAFYSGADNLVPGDSNGFGDVFVKDAQTGAIVLVSTDANGGQGDANSADPSISADGRYVAFLSGADNLVPNDTNPHYDIYVKDLQTGAIVMASTDAGGDLADNDNFSASISADGRYVAFQSAADNLVPGDTNGVQDIFVKDVQTGAIVNASTDAGGDLADGDSIDPSISANGRYVVFWSGADNLVAGDTNAAPDVFIKDLQTGAITRVSTDANGVQADSSSFNPSISADGRYVTFYSFADNLVPDDTNGGVGDVFVKDLQTGAIVLASTDASGGQANSQSDDPTISADGRYVAFHSQANNLVPADAGLPFSDNVFVKDLDTGAITQLSEGQEGAAPNGGSGSPFISADGSFVVFDSGASNLVGGPPNGNNNVFLANVANAVADQANAGTVGLTVTSPAAIPSDISIDWGDTKSSSQSAVPAGTDIDFRHQYAAGLNTTATITAAFAGGNDTSLVNVQTAPDYAYAERVSTDAGGGQADSDSFSPSISADGGYVAFYSTADNLVAGDTNSHADIFVKDLQTGAIVNASTDASGGQADKDSGTFSISADGGYVAFSSAADNLVAGDINGFSDVFVKNLLTGAIVLASTDASGGQADANSSTFSAPSISADGRYVAFESVADNLVTGDTNGKTDIFVKDLQTGAIVNASTDSNGGEADGPVRRGATTLSTNPSISADGHYVAFQSAATNLVADDTNGQQDIFVKDLQTGAIVLASTDASGGQADFGGIDPSISADGRYVAFQSFADNLVAGDTNAANDIFVKDLDTGAIVRASTDANGGEADSDSYAPSISADGRYVAFYSYADNLVPDGLNTGSASVFIKDLVTGAIVRAPVGINGTAVDSDTFAPSISADGKTVAYYSSADNLVAGDTNGSYDIFVSKPFTPGTTLTAEPGGSLLVGNAGPDVLTGGPGDDRLIGGAGNDILVASGGTDVMTGEGGHDRFVFNAPGPGTTAITDFAHGEDLLVISAAGFGGGLVAGDSATVVTAADASAATGGAGGYFIYVNSGPHAGTLYWDHTGGSGADAVPIVHLETLASLTSSDFLLV